MSAPGTEYWIVATSEQSGGSRDGTYSLIKQKLQQSKLIDDIAIFGLPAKLKFGRLDDLLSLLDDVQKYDSYIEQACHRLEKMGLDIDPSAEFKIIWQRNTYTADEYLKKFVWDEAKYSPSRLLRQNVELIVNGVSKLDEEIRVKASQYQELKNQVGTLSKVSAMPLTTRDLVDVLTPDVVTDGGASFVFSEKLCTVVCVVPKTEANKFETSYWKLNEKVVPHSLMAYDLKKGSDSGPQDENVRLYSVVMFRTATGAFKDACRPMKVTVREGFKYDPKAFAQKNEKRTKLEAEKMQQESVLARICVAAFSECFVSLVHMKAVNVYIEGLLRHGANAKIAAYIIQLPAKYKEAKLRHQLMDLLGGQNVIGKEYFHATDDNNKHADDEQLYPYVQLQLVPFLLYAQK